MEKLDRSLSKYSFIIFLLLLIHVMSCSPSTHNNIASQRIVKRDYFKFGFTNQTFNSLGNGSVKYYDLRLEWVRDFLIAHQFKCAIGGHFYRIAKSFAGLTRRECLEFSTKLLSRKIYCKKKNHRIRDVPIENVPIGTVCRAI